LGQRLTAFFDALSRSVDILSKGRHPPAVQEHFSKFTDATGEINWEVDESTGKQTGHALGCRAKDGERFPYNEPLLCEGAVEDWLNMLMDHQCSMFRAKTKEAIDSFVEYPREKWIEMYTAQHCLSAGQVWWTAEVFIAFDRLEQGNENAMKEYFAQCVQALVLYATMVLGEMVRCGCLEPFVCAYANPRSLEPRADLPLVTSRRRRRCASRSRR